MVKEITKQNHTQVKKYVYVVLVFIPCIVRDYSSFSKSRSCYQEERQTEENLNKSCHKHKFSRESSVIMRQFIIKS